MLPGGLDSLKEEGIVRLVYPPKDRYQTTSGKVEFWSSAAERLGMSPLPVDCREEPPGGFPLRLISSSIPSATGTQDEYEPAEDAVHLSPEDATRLGAEGWGSGRD